MWSELEKLVRAHSTTSEDHGKVLECLLECKKPSERAASPGKKKDEKTPEREVDAALRELEALVHVHVSQY